MTFIRMSFKLIKEVKVLRKRNCRSVLEKILVHKSNK